MASSRTTHSVREKGGDIPRSVGQSGVKEGLRPVTELDHSSALQSGGSEQLLAYLSVGLSALKEKTNLKCLAPGGTPCLQTSKYSMLVLD